MTYVVPHQLAINEDLTAIPQTCDVFISILRHASLREEQTFSLRVIVSIGTNRKVVK